MSAYKHFFFYIAILVFHYTLTAQNLSVQISPGFMNYGGDLQSKAYTFQHADFSIGVYAGYRINQFLLRAGFTTGKIHGDDLSNTGYKYRNLSFASSITDVNLCLQYDFHLLDETRKFTPYVFAGAGIFHFNPYTIYNSQKVYLQPLGTEGEGLAVYPDRKMYSLTQPEVPYGIGFKYRMSDRVLLGLEFSSRFLFTDYVDDVSNTYPDENELFKQRGQLAVDLSFRGNEIDPSLPFPSGNKRANPDRNDNYYTSTFSFIYVFPKQSEYKMNSNKQSRKSQRIDCPKHIH